MHGGPERKLTTTCLNWAQQLQLLVIRVDCKSLCNSKWGRHYCRSKKLPREYWIWACPRLCYEVWAFADAAQAFEGWPYSLGSEWSLWLVLNIECYKIKWIYNSPPRSTGSLFSCNNPILSSSKDSPRHRRCLVARTLQGMSQAHLGHSISRNQTRSTLTIEINEKMGIRLLNT
jgi:hypothetical protein